MLTAGRQMATLDATKLLLLKNQTKLTLTVTLTLNDTVTVMFFIRISLTPIKRLYRINESNVRCCMPYTACYKRADG